MNFIAHSVLALASVGVLAQCKSKETTEEAGNASGQSQPERTQHQTVDRPDSVSEGESYKDKKGLAMNRNEITHSLLTREKPEWLTIGSPVSAESFPEQGSGSEWKSVGEGKTVFSAGGTVRRIGDLELPDSLAAVQWSAASFDPNHGRLLLVPLEQTEPASLFRIEDGKILEDSREEVPSINYDDKRRWFIQWENWISDSEIVGVLNEEDISGHTITRSVIYLYDMDTRELRRVDLPYGFITGNDPSIEIVSVSQDSLILNTTDGEKIVSLKK